MTNSNNLSNTRKFVAIPIISVILISYGYANLFMMFVLQHLITPTLHIPALIVLIALFFIPMRFAVHRAIQSLDMLPIATQVWFIG